MKTTYSFDDREDPRLIIVVSVRANTNIDPTWMTVRLVRCSKFEYTEVIQSRIRVISNFRRVKCQVKGQWVGGRGLYQGCQGGDWVWIVGRFRSLFKRDNDHEKAYLSGGASGT